MFCPRLFLFDEIVDQSGHGAATDATWGLGLRPVRVPHETQVKRLLSSDGVIIVEGQLATFTALKVLGHGLLLKSKKAKVKRQKA